MDTTDIYVESKAAAIKTFTDFFEKQKEKEKELNDYWKKYNVYEYHRSRSLDKDQLLRMIANYSYDRMEFNFKISMSVGFVKCFGYLNVRHNITFTANGYAPTTLFIQESIGTTGEGIWQGRYDIPNLFAYSYLYLKMCDDKEFAKMVEETRQEILNYGKIIVHKPKNTAKPVCYIMVDEQTNYTKIGFSVNPEKRERTLQSEKPTIKLIHIFEENHERMLHNEYSNKRVRGEWFNLTEKEVNKIIKNYK